MKRLRIISLTHLIIFLFTNPLLSQEYLTSPIYQYYRFLELNGVLSKPALNYHSQSTPINLSSGEKMHIWSSYINLKKTDHSTLEILPIEFFYSYNPSYPRGFNNGVLWEGKGNNFSIIGGIKLSNGGVSLVLAPTFWFSQNLSFPLIPPDPSHSSNYASYIPNIDEPQLFGESPIYKFDWGESELRFTHYPFTLGIGTQSIWIGPSFKNAIILSNNAGGFPKIDIGFYPFYTSLGIFEGRIFFGTLKDSPYADENLKKNRILLGYSLSYSPYFIPQFTVGFHRTALTYSSYTGELFQTFYFMNRQMGADMIDQRASLTFEWLFPKVGFSAYGEWARNDFNDTIRRFLTQLHHSQAYSIGIRQITYSSSLFQISLLFELTQAQHTIDYQTDVNVGRGTAGFYTHHIVRQGHTHNGQILGAAVGSGGSSQYLGIDIYSTKYRISLFTQRRVINIDYIYGQSDPRNLLGGKENIEIAFGSSFFLFLTKYLSIQTKGNILWILNSNYQPQNDLVSSSISILLRYSIN